MNIETTWTMDTKSAEAALNRQSREMFKLEDRIRKITGASLTATQVEERLKRARVTSLQQANTESGKLERRRASLQAQLNRLTAAQKKQADAAKRASQELRQGADQASVSLGGIRNMLTNITAGIGGGFGLYSIVQKVGQGFQVWIENLREVSAEVNKASGEIIAFAALQEGGTKAQRVQEAAALAQRYGITERGEAFDTLQAMQSRLGSFEKGKAATETIFAAAQVGIPVELGREIETLGQAAGMKPGDALRKAFAAGEASARTPAAIARAAEAMAYFGDKDFMFAMSASLAGTVPERQIATYMKRGGQALAPTSGLKDWYEERGLGKDATQLQRFQALAAEVGGLETSADIQVALEEMGLSELRERKALADTIPHLKRIMRLRGDLPTLAAPGILTKERVDIEAEMPTQRTRREIDQLIAMNADLDAIGPTSENASRQERRERAWANALMRRGKRQALWFDLQEDRRTTQVDLMQAVAGEGVTGAVTPQSMLGAAGRVTPITAQWTALFGAFQEIRRFTGIRSCTTVECRRRID
jgi:hypothetical protein